MAENRTINIKVNIEGNTIPITAQSPEEEQTYRKAASLLQARIQKYRNLYPNLKNEMYYSMAMLITAVDAVRAEDRQDTEPYTLMMKDLEKEIDVLLK